MKSWCEIALQLTTATVIALGIQGCASTAAPGSGTASRNAAGQSALDGMENSVLKDNNPDTPNKVKP